MYSKELEEVIDAILADGVITPTERRVLHRRAQAEGVDLDELDVIVDGRLAKMRNSASSQQYQAPEAPSIEKQGNVVKCPSCNALVDRTLAICPECGYAFTNVRVASSIQKLYEKLEKADGGKADGLFGSALDNEQEKSRRQIKQKIAIISNAPIPTAKEDMLEFLSTAVPNATIINPLTGTRFGRGKIAVAAVLACMLFAAFLVIVCGGDGEMLGIIMGVCVEFGIMGGLIYVLAGGNASDNIHNQLASAWKSKCEQIVIKAQFSLRDDPKTLAEIEHYAQIIGIKKR